MSVAASGLVVHLPDQRPDLRIGELRTLSRNRRSFLGEQGERRGGFDGLPRHGAPPEGGGNRECYHWLFEAVRRSFDLSTPRFAGEVEQNARSLPGRPAVLAWYGDRRGGPTRSLNAQDPAPHRGHQTPSTPPRARRPNGRSSPDPARYQLRARRRHRHRWQGGAGPRPQAEEFIVTEDNKPQKVEQFTVVKIDAIGQNAARRTTAIRSDFDEEREAARPDVRLFVLLLDDYHVRRGNDMASASADRVHSETSWTRGHVAIMYPLTPVADIHFSRNRNIAAGAIERFEGRKFGISPGTPSRSSTPTTRRKPSSGPQPGDDGRTEAAAVRSGGLREGRSRSSS